MQTYYMYPGKGIAKVSSTFTDNGDSIVILRLVKQGTEFRIPKDLLNDTSLRPLISPAKAKDVLLDIFSNLSNNAVVDPIETWNTRNIVYQSKVNSGRIEDLIEVFLELHRLQTGRDLSFGERKVLAQAHELLITELSVVLGPDYVANFWTVPNK